MSATRRPDVSDEEHQRILEALSKCNGSKMRVAKLIGAKSDSRRPLTVAEIRALYAKLPPFKG